MHAKYFALTVSIGIFCLVLELIRRQKMTFRYSLFWLSVSFLGLVFGIFDHWISDLAHLFGFKLTSNFIFFLVMTFFTGLSLLLTLYINEQNDRTQLLAQAVGTLEFELQRLETKIKEGSEQSSRHRS
ncbi:MAG: hypothetical protein A2Z83_02810 [Omnitrophica bacterium GWA2_52_8]|nr:MAG: hypothetical protein A2Z83_02810 [Omnitrophica bacterium GWA2_52_8]